MRIPASFQSRVAEWVVRCFGQSIAYDRVERNHRFLEEALELVQSLNCTRSEAHQLVDYVFGRPKGEPVQELGGVMVTLAALANANELDMAQDGQTELARVWTKVEVIRAKQAAKPKHSPLPQNAPAGYYSATMGKPLRWYVETSYGCYCERGWCYVAAAPTLGDAIAHAAGFTQMRVYDNETGEIHKAGRD